MANQIEPTKPQQRLTVIDAERGGFIVVRDSYDINGDTYRPRHHGPGLMFAGSLEDCLGFIREFMAEALTPPA